MLITPLTNQASFGVSKYNLADYNRCNPTPVAYYNVNSDKSSIRSLTEIFLGDDINDIKHSKKPKSRLLSELDKISQIIAKTYHVFIGDKLNKYTKLTDKIL